MYTSSSARAFCTFLFLIVTAQSNAQMGAGSSDGGVLEVAEGAPLAVQCSLRLDQPAEWFFNGSALPEAMRATATRREEVAAGGREVVSHLELGAAAPHHAGRYTCTQDPDAPHTLVRVLPRSRSRIHTDATVSSVSAAVSSTTAPPVLVSDEPVEVVYDVGRELVLKCNLPRVDGQTVSWTRNHSKIENNDRIKYNEQGMVLQFIGKSQEDDYGNYSCIVGNQERAFFVRGRARVKLPANSNVVEGQNLRLTCKLTGKPYPTVYWLFSNETTRNISVTDVLGSRAAINVSEQGVVGGELLLRDVLRSDAGNYTCYIDTPQLDESTTTVRVKDKYAALWPFLGICVEVFVLCAIILVYEKRRTKPELDDSDTDNHDQKKS